MTIYELRVDPQDVGKIIGRQGVTINAIRSLLLAGSANKGLRCTLEIVEDEAGRAVLSAYCDRGATMRTSTSASMKIDVLTLFPEMFAGPLDESIVERARQAGLLDLQIRTSARLDA